MKRKLIEELLNQIKSLEMSVLAIKEKDALSFSFLHDAFNKAQKLTQYIHDLEVVQVNAMKQETEKILTLLSEKFDARNMQDDETDNLLQDDDKEQFHVAEQYGLFDDDDDSDEEAPEIKHQNNASQMPDTHPLAPKMENTYKNNPENISDGAPKIVLNDALANANPPVALDLKRGISLNDRYLFQRELFNNDRHAMNSMMLKLNAFDSYEDVEKYLKENTSWDFEHATVTNFLSALKKGFE